MKPEYSEDIGEEIISRLKELNLILEKIMQEVKNGKEFSYPSEIRK